MNVLNKINSWLGYIVSSCVIVCILLTSIQAVAFCKPFYEHQYRKLDTAASMKMTEADLMKSTFVLLDYLKGDADCIDITVVRKGVEQKMFNERESLHMIDVKELYENAMFVRNVCAVVTIAGIIVLAVLKKKQMFSLLALRYQRCAAVFMVVVLMLTIFILTNFNAFWTMFHKVLFSNDLWLLDPRVDQMINLFPEPFFFAMVKCIILVFGVFFIGLLFISRSIIQKEMKKLKGETQ